MSKNLSAKNLLSRKKRTTAKKAHERYQNLSKEEKQKKQRYDCESYKNLSEDEKQKVVC